MNFAVITDLATENIYTNIKILKDAALHIHVYHEHPDNGQKYG